MTIGSHQAIVWTEPHQIYAARKPRAGQDVTYSGRIAGKVVRVEGNLCWTAYDFGETLPFIWCFVEGLNTLHDWPTKSDAAE